MPTIQQLNPGEPGTNTLAQAIRLQLLSIPDTNTLTDAEYQALQDLSAAEDAREIELRNNGTQIQWRYEGVAGWTDLVPLADLTGPAGANGNDGADGAPGTPGTDGVDGAPGTDGQDGADGAGVPTGGTTGQVLAKSSNADFSTAWITPSAGGGAGGMTATDMPWRPASYFGVAMNDHEEDIDPATIADNLAAVQDAIDWSTETGGGVVVFPAGICGLSGTAILTPHAALWGAGIRATQFRQLIVPTSAGEAVAGAYPDVMVTPNVAAGGSAHLDLRDFTIHGGWDSVKDYEGQVGALNWEYDPTTKNQVGLGLYCPDGGPSHPLGINASNADPHHTIERIRVTNVAGSGIVTAGRGEIFARRLQSNYCARYGIDWGSVDCFVEGVTTAVHGDSAFRLTGGNQRLSNIKGWFCGMQRSVEPVGAGFEIDGAGIRNVIGTNISTQDSYGPGIVAEGAGITLQGQIDEAGGGRLDQQGFGFEKSGGTRTEERSFLRIGNLDDSEISVTMGGSRSDVAPYLVDFADSGSKNTVTRIYSSDGIVANPAKVRRSNGVINAKAYHRVYHNGEMILGRVTQAQLDDATDEINEYTAPDTMVMVDGRNANRLADGSWVTSVRAVSPVLVGDGTATSFPIAHGLGTTSVMVQIFETSTGEDVLADVTRTDADTVTIGFDAAPANDAYTVVIQG